MSGEGKVLGLAKGLRAHERAWSPVRVERVLKIANNVAAHGPSRYRPDDVRFELARYLLAGKRGLSVDTYSGSVIADALAASGLVEHAAGRARIVTGASDAVATLFTRADLDQAARSLGWASAASAGFARGGKRSR